MPREKIILACTQCQERNYHTTKNRRKHPERVERRKYCPRCNAHTQHKETKCPAAAGRSRVRRSRGFSPIAE